MIIQLFDHARTVRLVYDRSFFAQQLPEGQLTGPFEDFFEACEAVGMTHEQSLRLATMPWHPVVPANFIQQVAERAVDDPAEHTGSPIGNP